MHMPNTRPQKEVIIRASFNILIGSLVTLGDRSYHLNDKFRRASPTFVIAGIAVVAWHVDGGPTAVRTLAPDMRTMPVLPSPGVTTLRHGGLVRCQIQQRLLLVVTRKIILRPAPIGRAGWLSCQRRLQHTLLPFQQPLHRLFALKNSYRNANPFISYLTEKYTLFSVNTLKIYAIFCIAIKRGK